MVIFGSLQDVLFAMVPLEAILSDIFLLRVKWGLIMQRTFYETQVAGFAGRKTDLVNAHVCIAVICRFIRPQSGRICPRGECIKVAINCHL